MAAVCDAEGEAAIAPSQLSSRSAIPKKENPLRSCCFWSFLCQPIEIR
jgi:hypothetical protein